MTAGLLSIAKELKIPYLDDFDTDPTKNLQYNGAAPPVSTKLFFRNLPWKTPWLSWSSLCHATVLGPETLLSKCTGDLLDVLLLGANEVLDRLYQHWVHQNLEERLDGRVAEDSKWQAR